MAVFWKQTLRKDLNGCKSDFEKSVWMEWETKKNEEEKEMKNEK
jgi:hypothetical protein